MSRHYGCWAGEPELDFDEVEQEGYAEMQQELADYANECRKDGDAYLFWQELNSLKEDTL